MAGDKEVIISEQLKFLAFILRVAPWGEIETLHAEIRRAAQEPYCPSNAIDAFLACLKGFLRLNPALDASAVPMNSKGRPLAASVTRIRPAMKTKTKDDFISIWQARSLEFSAQVRLAFNFKNNKERAQNTQGNPSTTAANLNGSNNAIAPQPNDAAAAKTKRLNKRQRAKAKAKAKAKSKPAPPVPTEP